MTPSEREVPDQPTDDADRLASFMGWKRLGEMRNAWWDDGSRRALHGDEVRDVRIARGIHEHRGWWNPLVSADHDFQVLERAREMWASSDPGKMYRMMRQVGVVLDAADESLGYAIILRYRVGDWSRAVLAMLRSPEGGVVE